MLIPAHEDHSFDDWWFGVVGFSDLPHIRCHTGVYFLFGWDLQIFIELHAHPYLRNAHQDEDVFVILSWSPSGASLEPSTQAHIFRHLYIIVLLIPGDVSLTFGFDLDYWDHTFDDGWFHVTQFPTYHISDAISEHISISVDSYRSSRSCMIIPTYGMLTETMAGSLPCHDPSMEPLWSHPTRPTFFGIWLSSCLLFRETFHRCLGLIWITEIAHLMMDDFMSPNFWPIVHLMPYGSIFPFWVRFTDLHGVVWSPPLTGCVPRRWRVRYFYEDFSLEPLGSHPVRPVLLGT